MGQVSTGQGLEPTAIFKGDLKCELDTRISLLPEHLYTARKVARESCTPTELRVRSADYLKPGSYCLTDDDRLAVSEGETLRVLEGTLPATTERRIRGMICIRNAARHLLNMQSTPVEDSALLPYRAALNGAYDRFALQHGCLHARANIRAFRSDPDLPLMLSLEYYDEETRTASKTEIFSRRTVGPARKIERCETPEEALEVSLHERASVDVGLMAQLLGRPESAFIPHLAERGLIFRDPESGQWETADAYLGGNVRRKLEAAQAAGPAYAANVTALTAVIPADLGPGEIGARIGSTWIPTRDYAAFLDHLLECSGSTVEFSSVVGTWEVQVPEHTKHSVVATQTYGTKRVPASTLFLQALNLQLPTVRDRDPHTERYMVNKPETVAARERQQQLREAFREWLFSDPARTARLVRCYNDTFNAIRVRTFDGSALRLPGYSNVYELHPHQKDGAWRIITSPLSTLLAHAVGAGKTLAMICAGMELRRLGFVRKPAYVVPNNMLEQFTAEFVRAYPNANVLMASKEDLLGDKRRTLLSRIATGDWDAVLLTHPSYERIKMSDRAMRGFIKEQIREIVAALREYGERRRGNRIVKELERAKKNWTERLERFSAVDKKDPLIDFEQLGIDFLFIDEAHYFKNLYRLTKIHCVAGLPNTNSERAFDMFVKTRHIMALHEDQWGVVFATGTPITNSIAECWTMQRYLQPKTLQAHQVEQFDAWAGNFGEAVTALELSPEGRGYRMHTRFARFVNLPELRNLFGEVADIRTAQMLKLPVPRHEVITVAAKAIPQLKAFVQTLVLRAEAIHNGGVPLREDNMLKVTTAGRKAALDLRLIDPTIPVAPGSKVSLCVNQVHEIWQRTASSRATQLVFCDLGTPKRDGRFSVYEDFRDQLIARGVPAKEIAFVQDATSDVAKAALFKSVREGRIRVLLGSTVKLGVGNNVQTLLVAIHHLDFPWRPADLEQRDGRILRQGNTHEEVWIYRYVTEGSFDAYLWQTLEGKVRYVVQFMHGDPGLRAAEDVELVALTYAEVKAIASGNPLVLEKAGIDAEVSKLTLFKSQWMNQRWENQREIAWLPGRIASTRQWLADLEADVQGRHNIRGGHFAIEINSKSYLERSAAGAVLRAYYLDARALTQALGATGRAQELAVGQFAGFTLMLSIAPLCTPRFVLLNRRRYMSAHAEPAEDIIRELEAVLSDLERSITIRREELAREEKLLSDLERELGKPFEKEGRLTEMLERQGAINALLDLDKNAAETMALDAEAA
jgi:N12 class adenine-specific DNA methylase